MTADLIREDRIRDLKEIGRGEFGVVYKGKMDGITDVALKSVDAASNDFVIEINVLRKLKHPNIVQYSGVIKKNDNLYIVMEYCKGNLLSFVKEAKRPDDVLLSIAIGIAEGMNYLKNENVLHRDLAARNILISQGTTAKISDFGLSRSEHVTNSNNKLATRWTAPEVLRGEPSTSASDVWSFGVVLYEMFTGGLLPYGDHSIEQIKPLVLGRHTLESNELNSRPWIAAIMKDCMNFDPLRRPPIVEIFERLKLVYITITGKSEYQIIGE